MTIFDAIIQGIIQGLTEFLPVSSSGHLSLVQYFTGQGGETGAFFSILLHAGTLIAIFIAFWKTILSLIVEGLYMLWDLITFKFSMCKLPDYGRMVVMLIVSTLPLFGFVFFKDFFQGISSDNSIIVEGFCFLFTSVLLFLSCKFSSGKKDGGNLKYKDALAVGIMQGVALLPGVSRSGATISTGLLTGMKRDFAVEYSFILGIPAVMGAIILEAKDVMASPIDIEMSVIITGLLTSAIFGIIAIQTVKWLVSKNKFKYFAYYTLILGVIVILIGFEELLNDNFIQNFIMNLRS